MKKLISVCLLIVLIIAIMPLSSIDFVVKAAKKGYFTYTVANREATIVEVDIAIGENVVIPDYLGGYSVTGISAEVFSGWSSLKSVTIPKTIKYIGYLAFERCYKLEKVCIFDIVAWCNIDFEGFEANPLFLGNYLYLNGELVSDLVIPNGVETIKNEAFYNCNSIKSVTIPKSVKVMGENAFCSCINLKDVYISDIEAWCNIEFEGGYTSNPLSNAKKLYLNGELLTDVIVPDGVTDLPEYIFSCVNIESVILPDSVSFIDKYAFGGCENLKSVFLGNGVIDIGESAFLDCKNLQNIAIPSGVTQIKDFVFHGCKALKYVELPAGILSIGTYAFDGSSSLTTIYYGGTEEMWQNITIDYGNSYVTKANKIFNYLSYIPGDINGDKQLNLKDVVVLAQVVANWSIDCNKAALDVNCDSNITLEDVTHLARFLAGWEEINL